MIDKLGLSSSLPSLVVILEGTQPRFYRFAPEWHFVSGWVRDRISSDNINSPANFVRLFCVAFSKATARRVGEKTPFLFCKAFFFVAIMPKKKASNKFWYQKGLAAFLCQNRGTLFLAWLTSAICLSKTESEKLTKEMPIRLRGGRHYAWGATFEKVDETIAQASANNEQVNQKLTNYLKLSTSIIYNIFRKIKCYSAKYRS